jgi:hypothetical protein
MLQSKKNYIILRCLFWLLPTFIIAQSNKIVITEFMAVNSKGIVDEDNQYSDWLELYNNTENAIDLAGWYLTDNVTNLKEWQFPSIIIPKGGYLVVFASDKNRTDPTKNLHTNFKLSGSGEFLAISEPDTTISYSYNPFPTQRQDVSYGIFQGQPVYFTTATPRADNVGGTLPFAPNFSSNRGFYKTAFDVTLSLPGGEGQIYYSTNGTRPSKTTGTLYTTPIRITTTTPLSAVTVNSAGISSEIITNTYVFIADVLNQPAAPAGYPTNWKMVASTTAIPTDYQMDPDICNSSDYKNSMETALNSIPTMSIVTNIGNLFSDANNVTTGGIYIYTGKPNGTGVDWVRPTSIEYYDPATRKEFQLNCQLKLHGGNSRNPANSAKHGFELVFKSTYGPSKLNFDLFDENKSAKEFNSLILRGGYNYTWNLLNNANANQRVEAQYIQDSWAKTTQLDMGHLSGHERFVHLYLNGLYWGLYNISEDYTNDYMKSYLIGTENDFDVIKEQQYNPSTYTTAVPTAGNFLAWKDLVDQVQTSNIANNTNYQKVQGKNADGTVNAAYAKLLEVDNYIDYMLINYYIGNLDWDKNNWTAARNRVLNDTGFRYFCWDAETTMTTIGTNIVKNAMTSTNPSNFMQYLVKNIDFKIQLADRIQKHMINTGGALTPTGAAARYTKLASEIDLPIIAESARWGDCSGTLYAKNTHWIPRKNALLNSYFPFRTDTVIKQLRTAGFFPTINAPSFTHYGGSISSAINLAMTTNTGTIYYTTDGTDPRTSITGAVASSAKTYSIAVNVGSSITVRARVKTSTEWSAITEATFVYTDPNAVQTPLAEQIACTNYPNPFNESTQIQLSLPYTGDLQLDIYSLDGRLVKQLFKGKALGGINQFDWNTEKTETGVYICRISYGGESTYIKLMKK